MNDGDVGYWFEEKIRIALIECSKTLPIKAVRLYDSKSAGAKSGGNWLPEQPGDMIWAVHGFGVLVELKASASAPTLNRSYKKRIRPAQIGGARLWTRAGCPAITIFFTREYLSMEVWDTADIVAAWRAGLPRIGADPILTVSLPDSGEASFRSAVSAVVDLIGKWRSADDLPKMRGERAALPDQ